MINVNKLKGKIVENGFTQEIVAKHLGITPRTFTNKLRIGIFNNDEIEKMVKLLNIENPMEIFFENILS